MIFINIQNEGKTETIDYFDHYREAKAALREYKMMSEYSGAYISRRGTKDFYREMEESKNADNT